MAVADERAGIGSKRDLSGHKKAGLLRAHREQPERRIGLREEKRQKLETLTQPSLIGWERDFFVQPLTSSKTFSSAWSPLTAVSAPARGLISTSPLARDFSPMPMRMGNP